MGAEMTDSESFMIRDSKKLFKIYWEENNDYLQIYELHASGGNNWIPINDSTLRKILEKLKKVRKTRFVIDD